MEVLGFFVFALIATFAIVMWVLQFQRGETLLDRWAASNGYTLVHSEYRHLAKGPFFFRSGKGNAVYRITVKDPHGTVRSGYARCGGFWLGMWLSEEVTVEWD